MPWSNFHSHTHYSDGSDAPEAYLREAVAQGLLAYGFSCHAPLAYGMPWCMKKENFQAYLDEIKGLRAAFRDYLQVYCALEADYLPQDGQPHSPEFDPSLLDYLVGSVHFVGFFDNGKPWDIDGTSEGFAQGLEEIWKNDARKAVEHYFSLVREMVVQTNPAIVGHLDKIRMHNAGNRYFSEDDAWYRKELGISLETIRACGSILEINTRGIYRGRFAEPYPAWLVLKLAREMKIPMILSSDAHKPHEITGQFAETAEMLLQMGIVELMHLENGDWIPRRFNAKGFLNEQNH